MKMGRRQIGPRVTEKTYDALQRLAAASNCTVSHYCDQVLANHIDQERGTDEGALRELEQRMLEAFAQVQSATDLAIKRLELNLNTVKAMVDAHVEARDPEHYEKFRKMTEQTLRTMGIQTKTSSNGAAS